MIRVDITTKDGKWQGTVYTCHMGYSEASLQQMLTRYLDEYNRGSGVVPGETFTDFICRTDNFRRAAKTVFNFEV